MTMPTHQCPWRMQIHHIHQEMPDVWATSLLCHDYYPHRAGQYALVSVRNSADTLRAYTISSTPDVGERATLTIRWINDGAGSQWLTRGVKRGDYIWLLDTVGEFTCEDKVEDKFLMLAAGCGVTPVMSMHRWLAKYRPQTDIQVIFSVRSPQDVILTGEQREYPVALVAENNTTEGFVSDRLMTELLESVPDLTLRTVMICGPAPYMDPVKEEVKALGATRFFKEQFFAPVVEVAANGPKLTKLQPTKKFYVPMGSALLEALESNEVPVIVACRIGICGYYKTKVVSGSYTANSTMTLIDAEVAKGYVLTCSCHPQGDLVLV